MSAGVPPEVAEFERLRAEYVQGFRPGVPPPDPGPFRGAVLRLRAAIARSGGRLEAGGLVYTLDSRGGLSAERVTKGSKEGVKG